jgi:Fic family protein
MASLVERPWAPRNDGYGLERLARRYTRYSAYVPDPLKSRAFSFSGEVAADVADAERAIATFEANSSTLTNTEALARLLLRAESVASSRIEGLTVATRRLLHADLARRENNTNDDDDDRDLTAADVLANIDAMTYAIDAVTRGDKITKALLLETHRLLLQRSMLKEHAGKIRTEQNWIGGNSYNPIGAEFVPPPYEMVDALLDDLCAFSNDDHLPAVAQAAIAHAQFETIHPFADGNGRVGRVLIHLIMRKRGLTNAVLPPVSLVLAARARAYVGGLRATRYIGASDSKKALDGINQWIGIFSASCSGAVADALTFERKITNLQAAWRTRLSPVRAKSTTDLLIDSLPGTPVTSLAMLTTRLDRSLARVSDAVDRFVAAGILRPARADRQRSQVFEAREVIEAFTSFERGLLNDSAE